MSIVWIVAGLSVAGAITALLTSWQRRNHHSNLGAVSDQWIAEHRVGQGHDPRR